MCAPREWMWRAWHSVVEQQRISFVYVFVTDSLTTNQLCICLLVTTSQPINFIYVVVTDNLTTEAQDVVFCQMYNKLPLSKQDCKIIQFLSWIMKPGQPADTFSMRSLGVWKTPDNLIPWKKNNKKKMLRCLVITVFLLSLNINVFLSDLQRQLATSKDKMDELTDDRNRVVCSLCICVSLGVSSLCVSVLTAHSRL